MANGEELIGKTLGKCKLLERIGHGKTSRIFKAFYAPLQKHVAVKVLKEDARATPELREKFLNEAKALARLDHENIVKIFDVVQADGYLMIIMELLKGKDLWEILREDGNLEPERAVEIAGKVARALEAAHRQGIVHRDVKPANVMIAGRREEVKLLDFGLATKGVVGGRAGTPHYMSPEQIQGKRVDEKTDVYSLGASFFHMLTGSPPYTGRTADEIKKKHLKGELPTTSRVNREAQVPRAVDPVIKRMMAPIAGYRFSARDLAAALDGLNLQSQGHRRQTRSVKAASKKGPGPLVIGGAIGVVVIIVVVVVIILASGKDPVKPPDPNAPGPDKAGPGTPDGPGSGMNVNRANDRQIRENLAQRLYNLAQKFESLNIDKPEQVHTEYKKVWDEYGETGWGQKAREKMRQLEKQTKAEEKRLKELAEGKERREAEPAFKAKLDRALERYDFGASERAITEWFDRFEQEDPKLIERFNRMEHCRRFFEILVEEINRNTKKYEVNLFKPGVPDAAVIMSADADGVLIKEGSLERKQPWSYFKAHEVGKLAERQFGYKDFKKLWHIANFYVAVGENELGRDWIMQAKGMDRFGWIDEMERKVKPK